MLGFVKKAEVPLGKDRWLTVVSPDDLDGTELLREPDGHPAVKPYKAALVKDGIPDLLRRGRRTCGVQQAAELGVHFTQEPLEMGPVTLRFWTTPAAS